MRLQLRQHSNCSLWQMLRLMCTPMRRSGACPATRLPDSINMLRELGSTGLLAVHHNQLEVTVDTQARAITAIPRCTFRPTAASAPAAHT